MQNRHRNSPRDDPSAIKDIFALINARWTFHVDCEILLTKAEAYYKDGADQSLQTNA